MARRRSSRFIRPAARTKMWIGSGVGRQTYLGSSITLAATLSAGALLLRPFTVLRTRMGFLWNTDQEAADETPHGTFAKLIVTDTAAALGITAIPDPSGITGDPEASWFLWQAMAAQFTLAGDSAWANGAEGRWYDVDSKSMRKVGPDDNIVSVVSVESAHGVILTSNGRMLIQLH